MKTTDTRDGKRKGGKRPHNVIHVAFGDGGGRLDGPPPASNSANASVSNGTNGHAAHATAPLPPEGQEPLTDVFTRREVAKLLGVTEARLRSLDKAEIVSPSAVRGKRRAYTFQDLIALRPTRELLPPHLKPR